VRIRPGTAVMIFDPRLVGVSRTARTFPAFDVRVIDSAGGIQTVRVVGLLPVSTQWPFMYVSAATGAQLFGAPWHPTWWAFRVKPGVDVYQFSSDLGATFGATYGMEPEIMLDKQVFAQQTLDSLERFLTGYLALGLVVGVSALGIVAGRAVVERRQQIGVLRAIGCSRGLVGASFLLESGFTAMLGLLIGAGVAIWAAYSFAGALMPAPNSGPLDFQVPVAAVASTVAACYAATLLSTWLPARAASRVRPAEALRSDA
jgi:putative ABC transport system permease protein